MRVAAIQLDIVWEDSAANFANVERWVAAAVASGAGIVVLPEMFGYGFSMQTERITEPHDGPSATLLRKLATEHGVWVMGSAPERATTSDKPFNTLLAAAPDGQIHRYQKIHPFTFAGEHEHYAAGTELVTIAMGDLRCTLFVCYDLRFADEFWSRAAATDCYIVVANWPEKRRAHWTTLLRARAIENQAYVVGVNRVGRGNNLDYAGDSRIIDPWGETLGGAAGGETMLLADLDPDVVAQARAKFPVLNDRR